MDRYRQEYNFFVFFEMRSIVKNRNKNSRFIESEN